jgi:hypothetical protein
VSFCREFGYIVGKGDLQHRVHLFRLVVCQFNSFLFFFFFFYLNRRKRALKCWENGQPKLEELDHGYGLWRPFLEERVP